MSKTQAWITIVQPISHRMSRGDLLAYARRQADEYIDGTVTIEWADGTVTPVSLCGATARPEPDICTILADGLQVPKPER